MTRCEDDNGDEPVARSSGGLAVGSGSLTEEPILAALKRVQRKPGCDLRLRAEELLRRVDEQA